MGERMPYARVSLSSLSAGDQSSLAVGREKKDVDANNAEAAPTETSDMAVVGHSVGDKRKMEHVEDLERLSTAAGAT